MAGPGGRPSGPPPDGLAGPAIVSVAVPELSVLLPAFNEAESLPQVWSELGAVLDELARSAEVIFVDDGSTDRTPEIVRSIRRADPRVRLIRLAANGGLSTALAAGLERVRGAIVVTMDSDLQNDPRDIPRMLASLEGYDAVTGWRQHRDDPWLKRAPASARRLSRAGAAGQSPGPALRGLPLRDPQPGGRGLRGPARGAVDAGSLAALRGDRGALSPRAAQSIFRLGGRPLNRAITSNTTAKS